ncbi:phage regulatory protein, rha family [Xylanibacter ruminicola]|uniref:Rha family transcriptional regulator n=1 Tax=Xylanibacter ruminicola TaxID=839 RepID=UPI0008F38983|nr:Rha family transcriptional regulator [Xylanibacter ruminicola]SFC38705.1 phage regulatory protein, rha family [Xylanibacter ruminicola]
METMIIKTVNENQHMMTSLEIAEVTGKPHNDVLKAIRKMEPAWAKVAQGNFSLGHYQDANGQMRPCYQLTKTETLYIATKFNDEARARLVLRWEELELERLDFGTDDTAFLKKDTAVINEKEQCLSKREPCNPCLRKLPSLGVQKQILAMADEIVGTGLRMLNEPAEDTLTATQVAKTFNMNTRDFNAVLADMNIQYRAHGRWHLAEHLLGRGYTAERTHIDYSLKGKRKIKVYMTWTMAGLKYLNSQLGYPNL